MVEAVVVITGQRSAARGGCVELSEVGGRIAGGTGCGISALETVIKTDFASQPDAIDVISIRTDIVASGCRDY